MQLQTNIVRVILASFISAGIAALWVFAEQMHWLIEFTEHEFIVLQTCAMIGGGIFAIQGALLLNGSGERINKMQHAILERNKVEFMALRDKKPAPMMFVVLIALATIILFQVGSMDFSTMHGAIVMFTRSQKHLFPVSMNTKLQGTY